MSKSICTWAAAIAALFALNAMLPNNAKAEFTGNLLKEYCDGPIASADWGMCVGYIGGSLDGFRAIGAKFCFPTGVDPNQIVAVSKKYFADHPEKDHLMASELILDAIVHAFPCKK